VTYSDDAAVDILTIGAGDIVVSGPNGFSQIATLANLPYSSNATPVNATYRINAPGGSWDSTENGTYTISLQANQVADTSGTFAAASTLTTFRVALPPDTVAPSEAATSLPAVTPGATYYYFKVTYSDDRALDLLSIDGSDVVVTGPNGFSQIAFVANLPADGDPTQRGATYRITAPGGKWDAADAGTYTVALQANQVRDLAGNYCPSATVGSFSAFTTTWTQTSAVDFASGSSAGTAVLNTSGGELALARLVDDEFNGTALGRAWTVTPYVTTGTATVASGAASVAGSQVRSTETVSGAVEGRIAFTASTQAFGIGTDLSNAANNAWAIFSTKAPADRLYARTNVNGATQTVDVGPTPVGLHTYRIAPIVGGFAFYVDGVQATTIAQELPATFAPKLVLSDVTGTAGSLGVDWVRSDAYRASGTFVSSTIDAGAGVTWGTATWSATTPPGTRVLVETSTSSAPDGPWSDWSAAALDSGVSSPAGRYLRFRVTLATDSPPTTPLLSDITFATA
jgi:hypothetical protein